MKSSFEQDYKHLAISEGLGVARVAKVLTLYFDDS